MDTRFAIIISLQLPNGKLNYGKFTAGTDLDLASNIFSMLKGSKDAAPGSHITIEFVQVMQDLPVMLGLLHCCIEELKENVAIISNEVLDYVVLENGGPTTFTL